MKADVQDLAWRAREIVEEALRAIPEAQAGSPFDPTPRDFLVGVRRRIDAVFRNEEIPTAFDEARKYWWELARLGAVALGAEDYPMQITGRGRRWLKSGELSPHGWEKSKAAVARRIANPDPIVMAYLEEAVGAWRSGLNRASVVMLGGACERLIVLLAHAVSGSAIVTYSEKLTKMVKPNRSAIPS